jgi:hypothetical protein
MRPAIFLSRPVAVSADQENIFRTWAQLLGHEFDLKRLRRCQYAGEPWPQLRSIFAHVDGVISFGFSQTPVAPGPGRDSAPRRTSPWLHIEAGIAISMGLAVLAIPDLGVSEGVFDPNVWCSTLSGVPAGQAPSRRALPARWTDAVYESLNARQRLQGRTPTGGQPCAPASDSAQLLNATAI